MATHILLKNNTMPTDNRPTLAIDTSTSFLSIALEHQGEIRLFHENVGTKQSEQILPQIERLFKEAGITAADLGCIVYAQGPGAFTGLRIGAAVAQGLATPFDTPMIGIPCLDAAASLLPPSSCVLAATDARMGEVFYAWFDTQNHVRLSDYTVGKAAAIAAPVGVDTIPVYPVANFGSQMAPMYSILALWVGSVLMVVSIRSDVTDENAAEGLPEDDPLRATLTASRIRLASGYLGRYLIFGTIALTQATLIGLGDLYFLKVQHVHPLEFMGTLWLTAVVFSFLMYTLIATFGNAGKALGVLLLVLQISGAGGAFPLAILPSFYSSISPFLPATHAMTALRASIAGYSGHEYRDAMWFLASFILFAAFLGLALRPLLVRGNRRMVAKLESTKLL